MLYLSPVAFYQNAFPATKTCCLYIEAENNICKTDTFRRVLKHFNVDCFNNKDHNKKFIVSRKTKSFSDISSMANIIKKNFKYKVYIHKCPCMDYQLIENLKCHLKNKKIKKQNFKKTDFGWEKELNKIIKTEKLRQNVAYSGIIKPPEEKNKKQAGNFSKRITVERYFFADSYVVNSQKKQCFLRGRDMFAKAGIKFAWSIKKKFLSLWGDIYGKVSYLKFMESSQKKVKPGIRYLYLTNESLIDAQHKYPGLYIRAGRIPLRDKQTLWYNNFLDGLEFRYRSTLFKCSIFAGKRIKDSRAGSFEEPTGIGGYDYILGFIDYQYLYRHHLKAYFIKERYPYMVKKGYYNLWNGIKRKTSLNWLALRITKEKNMEYWINLAYMWGKRERLSTKYVDCTARKNIEGYLYNTVRGFGVDAGVKLIENRWGVGARIAIGQGSRNGKKEFHLPRLSSRMDNLFGPNKVRYYGELTNPGLSNIGIISIFGGYEVSPYNWLEANLINYFLINKNGTTPFSRYFYDPKGNEHWLGTETDFIFNGSLKRKSDKWRYLLVLSYFAASDNFAGLRKKNSFGLLIRIKRYW